MTRSSIDSLNTQRSFSVNGKSFTYFSLPALGNKYARLPYSLKILLENLLRNEDGKGINVDDIQAMGNWIKQQSDEQRELREIAFSPSRVLMQDFTGVPAVVDLASMRDEIASRGADPDSVNPLIPVDLVIDHSVMVDHFGSESAFQANVNAEMHRNAERYQFLRWGQRAFKNFRLVPPGAGICHQVNLEYLARVVWSTSAGGSTLAYPDTLVGTDSHTTMINGLGVLGWGVGGIEAEAAMLGQPVSMLIPEVVGFRLTGQLREGITATDLVLTVVKMLREHGVVEKFVEFCGPALDHLSLSDRATIANMAPEYGATCGFFPIDQVTIDYLTLSGRDEDDINLVETYCKKQGLWRDTSTAEPIFSSLLELDITSVEPSLAGPFRPESKVPMAELKQATDDFIDLKGKAADKQNATAVEGETFGLSHGDVVVAAITSCTNTSNPSVMMAAGLIARNAIARGLTRKPWVKSSLAPGSKVVTDYLEKAGLQQYLDQLGFNLVGYGCTTCIGNSGPLPPAIDQAITTGDLIVSSVLSGNRNFEARIHQKIKANWLASPPLVVAYALAGTTRINLDTDPIANDANGLPVYLRDIWPTNAEIAEAVSNVSSAMFKQQYAVIFDGDATWQSVPVSTGKTYPWQEQSTYIRRVPFVSVQQLNRRNVEGARILAIFGDAVTTDHISPAGAIQETSPAGQYLLEHGVAKGDFNSYGSRRGNHEVMMRGTFANIRIKNQMVAGVEGGYTIHYPSCEQLSIYDAAMKYQQDKVPLVIFAGRAYGNGSSRDWAAKGPQLQGVQAVVAQSFERIHRSNLIGMGILPLQFADGENRETLGLTGEELIDISGIDSLVPGGDLLMEVNYRDGKSRTVKLHSRLDTEDEISYFQHGGVLRFVLKNIMERH